MSLDRRLALVRMRDRGMGAQQLRWIGADPDIHEAFYREHLAGVKGVVAQRAPIAGGART